MAKALSIRQPWAELILQGKKTIETRKWNTKLREKFYIHASKTIDIKACKKFGMDPKFLVTGAIVGKAVCSDTKEYFTGRQFMDDEKKHWAGLYGFARPRFGFLLKGVKRIKPVPARGSLNFFKVHKEIKHNKNKTKEIKAASLQ